MQNILNLWLASRCPLCDRSTNKVLCSYCQTQLESYRLKNHQQMWQEDLPVFIWGNYAGILKRAIATLKYQSKPEIGELLGGLLGEAWLKAHISHPKLVTVPIPLHVDKLHQRGYNQAAIIARTFARIVRLPYQEAGLIRTRATKPQFGLSVAERKDNLAGALALGKYFEDSYHNRPQRSAVLLIDDIYTTGATAQVAASVFRQSGIPVWGLAAIATPPTPAQ